MKFRATPPLRFGGHPKRATRVRALALCLVFSLLLQLVPSFVVNEALALSFGFGSSEETVVDYGNPGGGLSEIRSVGSVETRYGLVVILVDEDTWGASAGTASGFFSFLGNTKLSEKIETYAEDVQSALPWTKTLILTVGEDEDAVDVQRSLERFYFEGNPEDDDVTQLTGVVVVGEVPLPVVNKNGHRFVSVLPYTDFEDPAYLVDGATEDFVLNPEASDIQPEVWHGLIVPPLDGQEGIDLLASYFDKNHSYHSGDEEYTNFDERAFVADMVTEESTVNQVSYASYERFLDLWEEMNYSQYSADLLEEIYVDMLASTESEGDGLDNDGDGNIDEEAANGRDDDGDGYIDEDLGDGLYGIDNDEDGSVDEDGTSDNNNDADWVHNTLSGGDAEFMADQRIDEDPVGDANGDGCPGVCGVDDNGYAEDHDGDGYPTGWEVMHGYPPYDDRKPHKSVSKKISHPDGGSWANAQEATDYLASLFTDAFYDGEAQARHASCYDTDGSFHPEWDDDEDGFCDEDPGPGEYLVWANDSGTRASGSCLANDGDCDGKEDEDPTGEQPEPKFEDMPDIQMKSVVETLVSRYAEMFETPQGEWNRLVGESGRWDTLDYASGEVRNEYDTPISLISKKDEYVYQYLGAINDYFEERLDELVEDDLAADIPLIAALRISGEMVTLDEDGEEEDPVEFCDPDKDPDLESSACAQFVNFSYKKSGSGTSSFKSLASSPSSKGKLFHIYGQNFWDIDQVGRCSLQAGTYGDGQMVEFLTLYSTEAKDLSKSETQDIQNCVPENMLLKEDVEYACNPNTAVMSVRDLEGAIDPSKIPGREDENFELLEVGYGSCFEFREWSMWDTYRAAHHDFNDWLAKKLRKFRKNSSDAEEDDYAEFLQKIEDEIDSKYPDVETAALRRQFKNIDILADDEDRAYTVKDLFKDLGWEFEDDDERADDMDIYLALTDDVTIRDPDYGSGMSDVDELDIEFEKLYFKAGSVNNSGDNADLTDDEDEAMTVSSFYKHVMPGDGVLNRQMASSATPDLPIDKTRRMSFVDNAGEPQKLNYLNVFGAGAISRFERWVEDLAEAMEEVDGGESAAAEIADFMDEINREQLEDAIAWTTLSIDEKHEYVFTHYLGEEEPIAAKARNGYEVGAIVVDGTATEVSFAFNGNAKEITEEDPEFVYGSVAKAEESWSGDAEDADTYESVNPELSYTQPVVIWDWFDEIQEWMDEFDESLSSFEMFGGGQMCGDATQFKAPTYVNGSSVPDGAVDSVDLVLDTEAYTVLQPGGERFYVTVSARAADGSVSTDDNYTEVQLVVARGSDSIEVLQEEVTLTGGVATFLLESGVPGDFVLQAQSVNRSDVSSSNTLSGSVADKVLYVSTYVTEEVEVESEVVVSNVVEITDLNGNVVAVLDPESGDLELRDAEAELRGVSEGEALPTRVAIVKGSATYASIFLIPERRRVSIGEGLAGVFVAEVSGEAKSSELGVSLYDGSTEIGLVNELGQIALAEGYSLAFTNPVSVNVFEPIVVKGPSGEVLFTVTIKHEFDEADIVPDEGEYEGYLGWLDRLWSRFVPRAMAESVIPDSDGDQLDDLEEWTIGTDPREADSDGDGTADGLEVFNGTDPLGSGSLFSDMSTTHEAYADVVKLYLRGVLSGFSDGTMRPDEEITRENFVKVNLGAVCKVCTNYSTDYEEELLGAYEQDPFPDTDFTSSDLACIAEAKTTGIVDGYEGGEFDGYFLPQNSISWAEAIKVVVNTAELPVTEVVSTLPWHTKYVNTAAAYDLLPADFEGYTDARLDTPITRGEFASLVVNVIEVSDCRAVDGDGDGLSDAEEVSIYGTNPELRDSDAGGVNDLDEVVRGSDPLDGSDDSRSEEAFEDLVDEEDVSFEIAAYDHEAGLYVVSGAADFGQVTVSQSGTQEVSAFTNEVAADGASRIFVRGEIRDENDQLYMDDKTSVIEFVLSSTEHGVLSSERVQVDGGVAETVLESSTVAGEVEVDARIVDGSAAGSNTVVDVAAGEAVRVALTGDSAVLPAGGEAVSRMQVSLYDDFGNVANRHFHTVTLEVEGGIELLGLVDEDEESTGIQVTTPDGIVSFRVLSSPDVETAVVKASLLEVPSSGETFEITHLEDMEIRIRTAQPFFFVGASRAQSVELTVVDKGGNVVDGFSGDVELSFNDKSYGTFTESTVSLEEGIGTASFVPGTLAGVGSILASSPGMESGSKSIVVKPGSAANLEIRQEEGLETLSADTWINFSVEAYDRYGNLVTGDSSTVGTLRLTDSTADFGQLSSSSFVLNQGVADFTVKTGNSSGKINIVAASTGLESGSWGGQVDYFMESEDFADIAPQMLYGSILGGPYGDVTTENYIAGWMTFKGKTQAMSSLITEPVPKKRIASVDARGNISLPEGSFVTQTVSSAGSHLPTRIQWRDYPSEDLMAEIFYVLDGLDSVEMEALSDSVEVDEGEVLVLREDSAAVVKVREDGQILVLDSDYSFAVNAESKGLGFVVSKGSRQMATITLNGDWDDDVQLLGSDYELEDWEELSSGLYVKPRPSAENTTVTIPTGNSSTLPMGLAIVDPDAELPDSMQPSLGYLSLESAEENGAVGWDGDNKNLLLFAAGNTVGESNLYYPSEVGVVLGDPTIALTEEGETNALGYTQDIGKMVAAGKDEILELVDLDYNDDGNIDVLAIYADGRIEVLQNSKSPQRLKQLGPLLRVENGIRSVSKGDFNGDGMDDMMIVTEESCFADEMCLYIYENIGGGFVAENLTVDGIESKPTQVVAADLNGDDYTDIAVVDENMKLYVVWNAEGELEVLDEIEDFGLEADDGQNLYADVVLSFDGLEEGSAQVEDLDAEFEFANDADVNESLKVVKSMSDSDGGTMQIGDTVNVSIAVRNGTGAAISDIYVADTVAGNLDLVEDSLRCLNCEEENELEPLDGDRSRPWIYGPVSLASGEIMTLRYSATVNSLPQVQVMVGQDLYSDYTDDDFPDLGVTLQGNNTGQLMIYYSDGSVRETVEAGVLGIGGRSYRRVNYSSKEYSSDTHASDYEETENPFGDADGDGVPDFISEMTEDGFPVPQSGEFDFLKEVLGAVNKNSNKYYETDELFESDEDADNDGLNDTIDPHVNSGNLILDAALEVGGGSAELGASLELFNEEIDEVSQVIEDVVSAFTCNGGCIAFLPSVSFLTPGTFTSPLTGTPVGYDPGFPVFGILPYLPVVCTGPMCYGSQVMRMYLSPTTTLGLGLAVCLGPYPIGQCFSYSIPLLQSLGLCDAINGFVNDALSKATSFASSGGNKAFSNTGSSGGNREVPKGVSSSIFDDYIPPNTVQTNVSVAGFPPLFTEWWKAQKFEFFRMLDLPDVTLIYPSVQSIGAGFRNHEGDRIEELTTNALGLEAVLNLVHSLPLVDVVPTPVIVNFPNLDGTSLELAGADWAEAAADARAELDRFLGQFCVGNEGEEDCVVDDLTAAEKDFLEEIRGVAEEFIAALELNAAIIESYAHIPEQILELRAAQAYYAQVIVCYVDAILGFSAGWLLENTGRVEAWAQWVRDMSKIVKGWELLIDLSLDLMDSCDQCTNQRWSGIQMLLNLFVFVPDLPVIEMPKLPDIVLDVSNIQAGLDIAWPDLEFVPVYVDIPEAPRLALPGTHLNLDVDLDLVADIPLLPTFDLNVELPELPGLTLPSLPTLPPPPSVPSIDPSIKAALSVASNLIKIICTIRQGFVPVPEYMLKGKIEDITQRPSGTILPIDVAITTEWPSFNYDFYESVNITTYVNLTYDFSLLYQMVAGVAEQTNGIVSNAGDVIEEPLVEIQELLMNAVDIFDFDFGVSAELDAEVDLEEGASVDDELELQLDESAFVPTTDAGNEEAKLLAEAFQSHPLMQGQLAAFGETMKALQSEVSEWAATVPDEDITLVATDRLLALDDPLLNRYDEIVSEGRDLDASFLAQIEGTPLSGLAVLREDLIAFVEETRAEDRALQNMSGESLIAHLVEDSARDRYVLANAQAELSSNASFDSQLLALEEDFEVSLASETGSVTDAVDVSQSTDDQNTGIFIVNEDEGVAELLVAYTQEADDNVNILFVDLDNDGDDDVVYSMGGDVYIKENHSKTARLTHLSSDPEKGELSDYSVDHGSVQNLRNTSNDYQESSFSMSGLPEATGYDVLLYDSLDAADAEPDENVKRLLLLEETENDPQPYEDSPYTVHAARLILSDLRGQAELLGSVKRTLITENGELSMDDVTLLQTTEETRLSIEANGTSTQVNLAAGYFLELPAEDDRVIRVQSGAVLWIQEEEVVDEQSLADGWALLPEELLRLGSSRAQATLLTSEGAEFILDHEELFTMDRIIDPNRPASSVELENGAYYSMSRGLFEDGTWGTLSKIAVLNPQICGDDSAPFALIGGADRIDLPIYATTEISGANSFDNNSEIVDAFWDFDASIDVDGDGELDNDAEYLGLVGEIGPYDSTGIKDVTLWVTDVAGNTASAQVEVNVFVPEIIIDDANTERVIGTTEIASPEFPFDLVRERNGAVTVLAREELTDDNGDFAVSGFEESDLLSVYNAEGDTVAQFNPETKQAIAIKDGYSVTALAAQGDWPSRLAVYEQSTGHVLGSFIISLDEDLYINEMLSELEDSNLDLQSGMAVYFLGDRESYEISTEGLSATDDLGNLEVLITPDGNIRLYDDRYSLMRREADSLADHLILEIYDDGVLEMEIWPGNIKTVSISDTFDLGLSDSERLDGNSDAEVEVELGFEDISADDRLYEDIADMVERGILQGYLESGKRYFRPEQKILRSEFTKIILSTLCIEPSEEAYLAPNVFKDITDSSSWFYSWTKESFLRGLIHGYLGEVDANNLSPFKPLNQISRAEAVKIVAEALDMQGITELPADILDYDGAWYEPYMEQALELGIVTSAEAEDPSHILTRYEFVEMANRVLEVHNCFEAESIEDATAEEIDLEPGIQAVREACLSCPCEANIDFDSELRPGDTVFAIIRNRDGAVFGLSNKVQITK